MKILITADPELPVPPAYYGGIERIIYMLICELMGRGHDITLIANRESKVPCRLLAYPAETSSEIFKNMPFVSSTVLKLRPDIVHSFSRIAYLLPVLPAKVPKVMTYQRTITPRSIVMAKMLSRGTLHFTAISFAMTKATAKYTDWHIVYNGVATDFYEYQPEVPPNAPLVFLGRMEFIKGPHIAIEVAKKTGRRLVLMGNVPEEEKHRSYFRQEIAPHIDGKEIVYLGPVDDFQKNEVLGRALALLMPILWDEPFGIVMAEALACGTPVIGYDRGAVPEVVQNGVNGFVCGNLEQMVLAVEAVRQIPRKSCREEAEKKFSQKTMADEYEKIYHMVCGKVCCGEGHSNVRK